MEKWVEISKAKAVCWGETQFSMVDQYARLLLRDDLEPQKAAARIAHLEMHIGFKPKHDGDCIKQLK